VIANRLTACNGCAFKYRFIQEDKNGSTPMVGVFPLLELPTGDHLVREIPEAMKPRASPADRGRCLKV